MEKSLSSIKNIKASKRCTREELYKRISHTKEFIDNHLYEPLPLEKITRVACMSTFHFLRVFTSCYNITPYQYILNKRMVRVRHLIEHSEDDLNQIFNHSGFENYRTFQRVFQRQFGMSPAEYFNFKRP